MGLIKVVTDSAASIPEKMAKEVELAIVPAGVQIDGEFYREGLDITSSEFYSKLETSAEVTTSQPSPGDFIEVYNKVVDKAKEIISIHITGKHSGTVQVAELVKQYVSVPLTVVDSESCSMGQGFIALAAAKAAQCGKSKEEILNLIDEFKQKTAVFVAVPTLKYLARSGKIGRMKAILANVLAFKPIIGVHEGSVEAIDKARSYPKALQRLISLMEERFPAERLNVAILHSNAPEKAEEFRQKVEERLKCARVFITEMGSALAVHGGQGMLGIAAYPAEDTE